MILIAEFGKPKKDSGKSLRETVKMKMEWNSGMRNDGDEIDK